jgi:hypothetical protein
MSDCALEFANVIAAGDDTRPHWHIYYSGYYVGIILPAAHSWHVWFKEIDLGAFDSLEDAQRAVAEWYYGPIAGMHNMQQ